MKIKLNNENLHAILNSLSSMKVLEVFDKDLGDDCIYYKIEGFPIIQKKERLILANKCKKEALKLGFRMMSLLVKDSAKCELYNMKIEPIIDHTFRGKDEPEAIFKAYLSFLKYKENNE